MDLHSFIPSPNNLVTSGGLLIILQSLWSKLLGVLSSIAFYIKDRFIFKLVYTSNSGVHYTGALKFLTENKFLSNARSISPSASNSNYQITLDNFNFKLYKKNLIFFNFTIRDLENGIDRWDSVSNKYSPLSQEETLDIFYLGWNPIIRDEIKQQIADFALNSIDMTNKYKVVNSNTDYYFPKRPSTSVFLPNNQLEDITLDIQKFLNNENKYNEKSIPYKRVYLLEGIPGSGKTSLVKTLASEFDATLRIINKISDIEDDSVIKLSKQKKCFCLIEEIDTFNLNRTEEKSKKDDLVELVGSRQLKDLLTSLDGIMTPHGLILFMTTNYVNLLDKALIRPGRVDYRLEFKEPTEDQIIKACKFYCPDNWRSSYEKLLSIKPTSMSQIQEFLIQEFMSSSL